jgi:predicted kinase
VVLLDSIRVAMEIDATDEQGSVILAAREKCREHLRLGRDFAFNATDITRHTRRRWIDLFADYGARIESFTLSRRSKNSVTKQKPSRTRSRARKFALTEKLEPPQMSEAHAVNLVSPDF